MTELEWINSPEYINALVTIATLEETPAEPVDESYTNPLNYNLVADADRDCLFGECDHFCGEPTQYDLERLEANGYGDDVDAYERGVRLVLL